MLVSYVVACSHMSFLQHCYSTKVEKSLFEVMLMCSSSVDVTVLWFDCYTCFTSVQMYAVVPFGGFEPCYHPNKHTAQLPIFSFKTYHKV